MKFRRSATTHASNFTSQCVSSFPFLSLASFFFPHGGFFLSCQVHLWAHFLSLFSAVTCGGPRVGPQTKHMPTPPGTMSRGRRHGVGLVVYSSLGSTSLRAWALVVHRYFPGKETPTDRGRVRKKVRKKKLCFKHQALYPSTTNPTP